MNQLLTSRTITYSDKGHNTTIDLIFATSLLFDSYISCHTKFDQHSFDHHSIETVFNLKTVEQLKAERRQFRKTNPESLRKHMTFELEHMPANQLRDNKEIDEQVERIMTAIQKSIEASTQLVRISKYSMLGFDEECKEAVATVNRLHKIYQESGDQRDWDDYANARNWKKTLIRKMKRKAYRESREKACESPIAMWRASR